MLSAVANSAIKLKTHRPKHDGTQTGLISQRSLKLGAIPRYLTTRKVEWALKEEERVKNMPDPDCPLNVRISSYFTDSPVLGFFLLAKSLFPFNTTTSFALIIYNFITFYFFINF